MRRWFFSTPSGAGSTPDTATSVPLSISLTTTDIARITSVVAS